MEIHSTLHFRPRGDDREIAIRTILALPEVLRPTRHKHGQDEAGLPIGDVEGYLASPSSGSWLFGKGVSYRFGWDDCQCVLDVEPDLAVTFMERMAAAAPTFGYACAREELDHRNRLFVEIDGGRGGSSESLQGIDLAKYVPGLYWLTLLPETLAARHGVSLDEVSRMALEHVDLGDGQHLFRFCDRPDDWRQRAGAIDEFCARAPGMFDIHHVRRLVGGGVKTFAELDEITDPWR